MTRARPFVALDFETANSSYESACAVALVRVEGGVVVAREARRIRPSPPHFEFTHLHGIGWNDVRNAPSFAEVWSELVPLLNHAAYIAAHNARFDRAVLRACCRRAGLAAPGVPFRCTVALARQTWRLPDARLPTVCRHLGIPLRHHDPLSDAEACARIVLAARARHPRRRDGFLQS